jgi:glycosyltransferase involved in cell wall biosynthesis
MVMTHRSPHRKRILWIKADPLYPLDSGGKIRTFQMLKEWHRQHDITYLALFPTGTPDAAKAHARLYSSRQTWVNWVDQPRGSVRFYLSLLKNLLFSRNPYVIDKYRSAAAEASIIELEKSNPFDIVVADFLSMSLNIDTKAIDPSKIIVFQHNVESQIWKRHYETANNSLVKAYMYVQWRRYQTFEAEMCSKYKGVIAVSEDDAMRFQREFGLTNIIGHVPTGVDIEFFSGAERDPEMQHLMFLGSMDWMPNIDGIMDFVRTVYPKIKVRCPSVRLTIIGRNPGQDIRALCDQDASISVTGTVDDVRPYMRKASVSVVPLRVGGGTRIKIFETMAMGIPVVSSSIGAEGLPVHDGHNIYIADDPDTFAERVVTLLQDSAVACAMGEAGQQMVRQKFTWHTAVSEFDEMCERAISNAELTPA